MEQTKIEELSEKEIEVLTLFYNRFYELYEEITNENFIEENAQYVTNLDV